MTPKGEIWAITDCDDYLPSEEQFLVIQPLLERGIRTRVRGSDPMQSFHIPSHPGILEPEEAEVQ